MPSIKLTEALGLNLDGSLIKGANLLKVLPSFTRLADLPLDQVPVAEASAALNIAEPIPIPADAIALKLGAGTRGGFALLGPQDPALDEDDPFKEIQIKQDERYVALALKVSLGGEASGTIGSITFGFSPERDLEIRCYRRFQGGPDGFPSFRKAFATVASSFILPKEAGDLDKLQPDTIIVFRGVGTLGLSAGVSVSLPTESLASVSLVGDMKFEAKAGAEVGVDASVTITGGYQVRLRRLDGRRTELGVYTMKSSEAGLRVSANVGVSATVGRFDLAERVIGALSPQPAVDVAEFRKALPGEDDAVKAKRIDDFQSSIKAAISTKLQVAAQVALAGVQSHEAAWLFEIDPSLAITDKARAAITSAFNGDFVALTQDPQRLPPGLTQTSDILTDTAVRKLMLKINLLGLVNLISVGKLAQVTAVERNANGDITLITDGSSVDRLKALLITFGGNRKRLRKLLSENFLIEAAYRAKELGVLPPEFKASHIYFEIHDSTNREEMKNNLDVPRIFGLINPGGVAQTLGNNRDFGRTEFYAETRYGSEAVRAAFLKPQGLPPSVNQYEAVGRSALGALLMGDEGQEFRKAVAENDALWKQLKRDGDRSNFARIFGLPAGTVDPRVEAAGADFTAITSWADAMNGAMKAIQEIDSLLDNREVSADDPNLARARNVLKYRLTDVVKNTKEEFGDPLGMVMFYIAANQDAQRSVIITGDQVQRLELSSDGQLAARASD
jgi:hypothetical protein